VPAETHSHREFDLDEVRRVVIEQAAELFGLDEVDESTGLPDDAVAVCDLVDAVAEELAERTIGLDLDEVVGGWQDVGEVIDYLVTVLSVDSGESAVPGVDADSGHLAELEVSVGHRFADRSLLKQALQHRSFVAEHPGTVSNERLEFLGDAVLGMVVTDVLYRRWPDLSEGSLAKARAAVVSSEYLAGRTAAYDLGRHMYLGKGEDQSGGREKPSILADAMEAVIGAVYLDGAMEAARNFVLEVVGDGLADAVTGEGHKDYKTRLQELSAHAFAKLPTYAVDSRGPDHAKEFEARVILDGVVAGTGRGRSKKQAEQAAARQAWETHGRQIADGPGTHPTEDKDA